MSHLFPSTPKVFVQEVKKKGKGEGRTLIFFCLSQMDSELKLGNLSSHDTIHGPITPNLHV